MVAMAASTSHPHSRSAQRRASRSAMARAATTRTPRTRATRTLRRCIAGAGAGTLDVGTGSTTALRTSTLGRFGRSAAAAGEGLDARGALFFCFAAAAVSRALRRSALSVAFARLRFFFAAARAARVSRSSAVRTRDAPPSAAGDAASTSSQPESTSSSSSSSQPESMSSSCGFDSDAPNGGPSRARDPARTQFLGARRFAAARRLSHARRGPDERARPVSPQCGVNVRRELDLRCVAHARDQVGGLDGHLEQRRGAD